MFWLARMTTPPLGVCPRCRLEWRKTLLAPFQQVAFWWAWSLVSFFHSGFTCFTFFTFFTLISFLSIFSFSVFFTCFLFFSFVFPLFSLIVQCFFSFFFLIVSLFLTCLSMFSVFSCYLLTCSLVHLFSHFFTLCTFATGFAVTLCSTLSREMVSDVPVTYLLILFTIRTQESVLSRNRDSIMTSIP